MKVCGLWEKEAVMEWWPRDVETTFKAIGLMIKDKGKDLISSHKEIKFLWGNGLMIIQRLVSIQKSKIQPLLKLSDKNILQTHIFYQVSNRLDLQIPHKF